MLAPVEIVQSASLFTIPLLVAATGELVAERAGVVNISIEGMMLAGALGAWVGNAAGGPVGGFALAIVAAIALALLFALAAIGLGADQIVTGTGVNLLALGATALVYTRLGEWMKDRPVEAVSPVWMGGVAVALVAAVWIALARTRWGLELRALGENPQAAHAAGIRVNVRRTLALMIGAACAAIAGAYLSTMRVQGFTPNMTEGDGFLALAIVIFGRWHPAGVLAAGLFFGLVRAVTLSLQTNPALGEGGAQLFRLFPYLISLAALAGVAGKSGSPAGLGKAFSRA